MHSGILIIRLDNDPTRDMTPRHIITVITHLEAAKGLAGEPGLHSQSLALIGEREIQG
jgi:hypothetical protein